VRLPERSDKTILARGRKREADLPEAGPRASESRGKFLRTVVLHDAGKALCDKGSLSAVLIFGSFYQEKEQSSVGK
jgi:hypothetical protein